MLIWRLSFSVTTLSCNLQDFEMRMAVKDSSFKMRDIQNDDDLLYVKGGILSHFATDVVME